MAGFLPQSEGDLFRARPSGNQQNVFPRESLLGDEKVLYECRPGLFASSPFSILFSGIFIFLFVAVGISDGPSAPWGGVVLAVILFGIPLWYALYTWRSTTYAMTNQRVLIRKGASFDSLSWTLMGDVYMVPKSSKVTFQMTPPPPGTPAAALAHGKPTTLVWKYVPGAAAVGSFAKSALLYYSIQNRQRELRQQVVMEASIDRIACEYCGNLMRIDMLDASRPKCTRCGAPIVVA